MFTNHTSIDKPWSSRYPNNPVAVFDLEQTIYAAYVRASSTRLDDPAIYVDDTKKHYTHRDILTLVDKASTGFHSLGISNDSTVGIFLNGSVEEAVTLLALSKLGAISKYIDFMKSISAMKHSLEETNLDLLVMDECFLPLDSIINEQQLPIVVANSAHSYNDGHIVSFETLCQKGGKINISTSAYVDKKPAVMINSSGTTGEPKPIVHTDYSVNAAVQKMLYTDYPLGPGNVLIKMIPSQIGLGLITSLYTGLISGTEVALISGKNTPELTGKLVSFVKNFNQFKEDYRLKRCAKLSIFTAPVFIRSLVSSEEITDLSFIGAMLGAGSKMTKEELDVLEEIAFRKGCTVPICNGYGQNEMGGAVTLNTVHYNVNGSAGFPTYGTDVIVVHPETKKPLASNQVGLILESCNSSFLKYEHMVERTEEVHLTLADGSRWFNSYDLGYMDENGFLYITGRATRVVVREDFKISLDEVERKIRALPFVIDCATIVSEYGGSIEQIAAFIVSDNIDVESIERKIKATNTISDFEMPSEFLLVEKLPYKTNGKIDYELLKKKYQQKNNF